MLFEKDKYYKYIGKLEKAINYYYIICIILFALIGLIIWNVIGLILGGLVGFLLAGAYTLKTKILIQNMKWKMDMHELLKK